ncbi:MAG TPA: NADP-dependent oxidoreductase [Gemmatimonadaceae bacterium]
MPTPRTMRAIAIDHFGGPEELTLHEVEVPRVGPGEVLIKVTSAGVGVWDGAQRAGKMEAMVPDAAKHFPRVLGADGAGTVVAVGDGVRGFQEGDAVYGSSFLSPKGGFYAEYAAVPADQVARVPRGIDVEQAGALAVTGVTALRGLTDALDLKPSQRLLVFGASGGVGNAAVQLAKAIGAKVLAVVTTDEGATVAREAGADAVANSKTDDLSAAIEAFAPDGLDAVLAFANGEGLDTAIAAVRNGGRVAHPNGVRPPQGRSGVQVIAYQGNPDRDVLNKLNALIESRPFSLHIDHRFPLADAAQAHRALADHHVGRMILTM